MKIMKSLFLLILFSCTFTNKNLEINDTYIPYRTGNKYGLVNKEGKEVIKPTYEWMIIANLPNTFIGYKTDSNKMQTSDYIYGDKIILKNLPYRYYSNELGLIKATQLINGDNKNIANLFTLNGGKVFGQDLDGLHIFQDFIHNEEQQKDILISTGKDEKVGYYLYNVKKQKLNPIFENATINDLDFDFQNETMTIVYSVNNSTPEKVFIIYEDNSYKISKEEIIQLPKKLKNEHWAEMPSIDESENRMEVKDDDNNKIPENAIYEMRWLNYDNEIDFLVKPYKISFKNNYKLNPEIGYLYSKNNKYGLNILINGKMHSIPAKYDEIIEAERGRVIRLGDKYGYVSNPNIPNKDAYIEPIFDYIPYDVWINYDDIENYHIVYLFDADTGEFICYGDSNGKLYYSEK